MKIPIYIKLSLGVGLMLLQIILGSCCASDISYWKEIKLLIMGVGAAFFVMATTEYLNKNTK